MRERTVEALLGSVIKSRGGWSIKWIPIVKGLPDRVVLLPGGKIFFVETKAPNGRLSPTQVIVHRRLERLGFPVVVLSTPDEVRAWSESL